MYFLKYLIVPLCNYFKATIPAAVELADTAVNNPGTNPEQETNVKTLPSIVVATNVPG